MQLSPSSGSDLNTRGVFQLASLTSLLWPQNPTENVCVTVLHVAFVIESVVILPRPKSDIIIRFLRPRLEHGAIDFYDYAIVDQPMGPLLLTQYRHLQVKASRPCTVSTDASARHVYRGRQPPRLGDQGLVDRNLQAGYRVEIDPHAQRCVFT